MGVRYLLDTHVFLWLLADPERVPTSVQKQLADRTNDLLVSAITAFELATKARLGKLDIGTLVLTLDERIADIGATSLPVSLGHAVLAGTMSWSHRDPFDRLLVAQAITDNLTLVTVDRAMIGLPTPRILTW